MKIFGSLVKKLKSIFHRHNSCHESVDKFGNLIKMMNDHPVLSQDELKILWERDHARQSEIAIRMIYKGETYGVASGAHAFLNQEEDKFRVYLKSIDNELDQHVAIVHKDFEDYLKTGEAPAPYYAWRIAIILTKQKMKDKEREFLQAWHRHFSHSREWGARYRDLLIRAEKRGIK